MKRARLTNDPITGMLKEQESGQRTADVCRKHGISEATFYKYKAKYGGMEVSDARKLKKLLAEAMLDNAILKDVASKKMVTPGARRDAVTHVCKEHDVSQRRACAILTIDRSSVRYCSVRPNDASIREAMRQAASERRRFGYRRIHVILDRQGIVMKLQRQFPR